MRKPSPKAVKAKEFLAEQPHITPIELSNMFKIPYQTAYNIKKKLDSLTIVRGMVRNKNQGKKVKGVSGKQYEVMDFTPPEPPIPFTVEEAIQEAMGEAKEDLVNNPAHYTVGGIETIDFIEAKELNYHLGNAVKYIVRAEHKGDKKQDLEKAIWYLTRELSK